MIRLVLPLLLAAGPAQAHEGHLHWWEIGTTWTWDLRVTIPLALSAVLYGIGLLRLRRRAGPWRGIRPWQTVSFAAGWLLLAAALVSPLHWLGERLFVAHMIEHEILMALAAPLLVAARPGGAILWGLPGSTRRLVGAAGRAPVLRRLWSLLTEPLVATALHAAALWAWHVPALYEAALRSAGLHWLQHASFFGTALLFWWALLRGRARERGYGAAVFYLFATALHSGFLGVLVALARRPVYPLQSREAALWGLAPIEDQQLAGLVMWVPAGLVYAIAALALAAIWIGRSAHAAP